MTTIDPEASKILVIIGGATAVGKTGVASHLARQLGLEILSADSRQFYREMEIGTAKPTADERAAAPHHFVDFLSVEEPYSVGDFERDALALLAQLFKKNNAAILVGGSGLFLKAVYNGLDAFPDISEQTKTWVQTGEATGGIHWLQDQLEAQDPVYFEQVDQQNPARLRRALEVCRESGQPYSAFLARPKIKRPFEPVFILLELPRNELYARIDARVDQMIDAGLEQEARQLYPYRQLPALNTVGYTEWFDFFDGKTDRDTAIEKIKQHSRNYAKRQATWFRKHGSWTVFHPADLPGILDFCNKKLRPA
ncbi:MAG: tRNA (adenosine(37)-N6)-dimethylallyltransferase MiaA [Lewinellaceae bacterium]|nr:tRNA (adenosine(37)-N6)-dimethylallyltransferase MiaA [Saprospiraceae bacterium]MCB9330478.1 tRNA (adenosine(37)-N6)-dimethylallyltransferase MiaA [Lewinellaceae bacterium]